MPSNSESFQKISVSKIEIEFEPYPVKVEQHYLRFLESDKRENFLNIIKAILPVKVVSCEKKLYAIEYISLLKWLKVRHPNLEIEVCKVKNEKSIEDVIQRICHTHFFKHLTPLNAKDLYGLECYWKKLYGHQAILEQKGYSVMLECD